MRSVFSTYHPIVNFMFFCIVIGMNIFMMHPLYLGITAVGAFSYAVMLNGRSVIKFSAFFLLPVTVVSVAVNALTNPRGATVLIYTQYSQITMESVIYGTLTGIMLSSVLLWFSCFNKVMTEDKFTYLFGKTIPSISLIFTMTMRFIPNFKTQIKRISEAQKCIGKNVGNGSLKERIHNGINIVSIMFTWALENAVDTADSMKSRGYGMGKRTSFTIYRFDRRDTVVSIFLMAVSVGCIIGMTAGACHTEFYPDINIADTRGINLCFCAAYFMLCFFPAAAEIKEVIVWRYTQSKI